MESLLPFLQGTCTPYNMPVYPGAQRIIAKSLINRDRYCEVGIAASFPADKPDGSGFIKQAPFRGTGPMITSGSQFAPIDGCSGLFASSMPLVLRCAKRLVAKTCRHSAPEQ